MLLRMVNEDIENTEFVKRLKINGEETIQTSVGKALQTEGNGVQRFEAGAC